jgi:ribosome-binding factor A
MTQKKNYRIAQINKLLQEEIAGILLTEIQNDLLANATITEVRTSRDLHHAIVFITAHKDQDINDLLESANNSAFEIRKILYSRLRLKRIPEFEFRYDESLDKAERIYKTLSEIDLDTYPETNEE